MRVFNRGAKVGQQKIAFTKVVLVIAAGFALFSIGVGVGKGNITLGPDAIFRKSVSNAPSKLDFSSVEQMYNTMRKQFDGELHEQELIDGLKRGLASATGDPYTEFLNAAEAEEFNQDLNGTFSGIGAELGKDENFIVIVAPIAGFPAEKAGLQPRDIIAEINGESAYNINVTEAVGKIRGEAGTTVKLKVIRDRSQELDFEIKRETITIPSVESEMLDGSIGYLKISRFSDDTDGLAKKAAAEFKARGAKGVILDLRNNPGGLLESSVSLSSLWLPKGKTVLVEKRGGVVIRTFTSSGTATLEGIPTVVLINEGSASASEITAGALRDNGAATLIGEQTFGKGSVQQLERLSGGGLLKVTVARWFTPDGKNIDKEGIEPDKKIEITEKDFEADRDPQLDAALKELE